MEKRKYRKRIVTKKEKLIQTLLYVFRFLNSKQIQEFLGHKDHRRINSWLKDLEEKGYIVRDFKPIYGTLTKPTVCYLTALGRGYIRNHYTYHFPKYLKRISRDSKVSKAFRIRCQIIADYYLLALPPQKKTDETEKEDRNKGNKKMQKVKAKIKDKTGINIIDYLKILLANEIDEEYEKNEKIPMNTLQFFTPAYFPTFTLPLLDGMKPDAYLRKRTTQGIKHSFLFVLDAYIPRFLLRYSIKHIFDTLDEEYWDDESISCLQFLFICPNHKIIIYLRRLLPSFLEKYYGSKEIIFYFTTRNQMYKRKSGLAEKIGWVTFSSKDF